MRLFCCIIISQGSQGISAPYTLTLPARSSVLYLWDRKIRKNPNPFPIWKIRFGLYWFGAGNRTGFSRLAAALRPHCGLIHHGFFKSCFCFGIFWSKIKTSVLTKVLIWYGRWNQIRIESVCFCDLFSTDFTRWSLSASLYYGRGQQTGSYPLSFLL